MNAAEVLRVAHAAGIHLGVSSGDLVLEAAAAPDPSVLDLLSRHKADIVTLLCSPQMAADLPPDWSEGIDRLLSMPCPPNVPAPRWAELQEITGKLVDSPWLRKAGALGWDAVDLWGCGIQAPAARVDLQGLAWLLKGRVITAMSDATCSLRAGDAPQTFYRRRQFSAEVTLAWRLGTPDAERGVFDDGDWVQEPDRKGPGHD